MLHIIWIDWWLKSIFISLPFQSTITLEVTIACQTITASTLYFNALKRTQNYYIHSQQDISNGTWSASCSIGQKLVTINIDNKCKKWRWILFRTQLWSLSYDKIVVYANEVKSTVAIQIKDITAFDLPLDF